MTILIPWFIFGVFNILVSQLISFKQHNNLNDEIKFMFLQIRGFNDRNWFLACLFLSFIPFYFLKKIKDKYKAIFISFLLSWLSILYAKYIKIDILKLGTNALPWHIQSVFITSFFMILGYFYKTDFERKIIVTNKKMCFFTITYILLVYLNYYNNKSVLGINNYGNNSLFWYIVTFLGLIIIIEFCKNIKTNKIISFLGANTLIIYCLHGKVLSVAEKCFEIVVGKELISNNWFINCCGMMICIVFTIIILIIPIIIINKWFPFVIGKNLKIKND